MWSVKIPIIEVKDQSDLVSLFQPGVFPLVTLFTLSPDNFVYQWDVLHRQRDRVEMLPDNPVTIRLVGQPAGCL